MPTYSNVLCLPASGIRTDSRPSDDEIRLSPLLFFVPGSLLGVGPAAYCARSGDLDIIFRAWGSIGRGGQPGTPFVAATSTKV